MNKGPTPFKDKEKESDDLLEITEVKPDGSGSGEKDRTHSDSVSESAELSEDEKLDEEDLDQGHDGVSSSKSMTSSATSFAQFSKSIKALVNYESGKLKKYVSWFKVALILTIIILIASSIVSFDIISASITQHDEYSSYVNEVGHMRYYTQSLSYYVRILSLIDSGIITSEDRDLYIEWIAEDSSKMHDINLDLYRHYQVLSGDDADIYKDEDIISWYFEGGMIR
jgi:hypothetical protein